MLYQVEIIAVRPDNEEDWPCHSYVVEAPDYKTVPWDTILPEGLREFAKQRAHEASVQWGFVNVEVTVARYFPARLGFEDEAPRTCLASVLQEWTYHVRKTVSK